MSLQRRKLKVKCLQKKKLDTKKKNEQCTRKISDFFGPLKEDMDFACMDVTDSDSDDSSTSNISNDAMQ